MESNIIIAYLSGIIVLFIFAKMFILPIKWLVKLIINSVIGAGLIWLINYTCSSMGFHIGLNIFTALFTGILGIPGVVVLGLIQFL